MPNILILYSENKDLSCSYSFKQLWEKMTLLVFPKIWEEEFPKLWDELVYVLTEMLSFEKNKWFKKKIDMRPPYISLDHFLIETNISIDNFLNEEYHKHSIVNSCNTYSLLLHMRKPDSILMIILDNFKYSRAYIC